MRIRLRLGRAAFAVVLGGGALAAAPGCGTDAVGIDECRDIERARCEAARSCNLGIDDDAEARVCERFARDGCLRGLATSEAPRSNDLTRCVSAIRRAGECAAASGAGTLARSEACGLLVFRAEATACDVVETPEEAQECQFLIEEPPAPDPVDAGGRDAEASG